MITLNNFTKLDNGQYQMILFMKDTDSQKDLPSATRPMSPEYFAVTVDYGVPANGSIVIGEDNKVLVYSAGVWKKAKNSEEFKLQELSIKKNGKYFPEVGYDGFNKVIVDVQPKIDMPEKGDLITLDSKMYRVLKTNGNVAEVLAMYATESTEFNRGNSAYNNSTVDKYLLNTFYPSLSVDIQNAIVEKTFRQDSWYEGNNSAAIEKYNATAYIGGNYVLSLISTEYGDSISRTCYILSIQDIIDYLSVTPSMTSADTTLIHTNIWQMFWNQTKNPGGATIFLRSALSNTRFSISQISGSMGKISSIDIEKYGVLHPTFQIDLSKVDFTKI